MRRNFLPLCIILMIGSFASVRVRAQAPTGSTSGDGTAVVSPVKAADVLAHARQLYSEDGARVALPEFEKALALFREQKDVKGEAITLGLIGNCYKKFGEHPKALEFLQRALAMKRELGDRGEEGKTLSHLGLLFWEMGQYPQAIEHFNQAIAIGKQLDDRTLEASARNNLGLVYDEVGDYRHSLDEYNHALELYRGTNFERGISDTIGNIGGTNLLLGEYAKALGFYQQALAIDERAKVKPGITLDLQNIALCYIGLGRLSEALETFDRSIKLADEAGLKKEAADSRKGKASALVQRGKYTAALKEYNEVLAIYEKDGLKQSQIEGLGDLGNLELWLGDAASAEKHFRHALELSRAINHPRGITVNLIALGDLEWRRKRFKEAAASYREALARAIESKDNGSVANARVQLALTLKATGQFEEAASEARQALEIARGTQARLLESQVHYTLGDIAQAAGRYEESLNHFDAGREIVASTANPEMSWRLEFGRGQALEKLKRDEDALSAYQAAVKTIELVRNELREERFRAGYIEDKYQVYVALVELLLKLKRIDQAFSFAERLRARGYLELLDRGPAPIRSDVQRQTEATLRSRIRQLQQRIEVENAKPEPEQKRRAFELFSKELMEAERDYQVFLDDLMKSEPAYVSVRALNAPTTTQLQQQLPRGVALIEYVVAPNKLVIFVLTSQGLRAKEVAVKSSELQAKVELLRDLMLRKKTDEWQLPSTGLYDSLIEPIADAGWLKDVNRLYIVPHSILNYLPFAALLNTPGSRGRALIDDYALAYLPAAAALVKQNNSSSSTQSMLAMAPASTRLIYTQQESQSVSHYFPKQRKLLLGNQATESSFKRFAGNYDLIHLATHGYFNKLNPLLSGLMLEPDAQEDGRMEVHEILGLKLHAQLVTLSACDTALGSGYFADVPAGDDLIGLTRAFLYAGTPSVLASLWEVNDRSAVDLMRDFYGRLRTADKVTALAMTQRDLRRRGPFRHPYYWSGFVLVGQMN